MNISLMSSHENIVIVYQEGRFSKKGKGRQRMDALTPNSDEGRDSWRYASASKQVCIDPRISEWGNPPTYSWF